MQLWYFLFDVKFYDDYDIPWEECHERGVICAENKGAAMKKLEQWFGDHIFDVRIYDVDMDTNEILLEKNFPGIIEMMENPIK